MRDAARLLITAPSRHRLERDLPADALQCYATMRDLGPDNWSGGTRRVSRRRLSSWTSRTRHHRPPSAHRGGAALYAVSTTPASRRAVLLDMSAEEIGSSDELSEHALCAVFPTCDGRRGRLIVSSAGGDRMACLSAYCGASSRGRVREPWRSRWRRSACRCPRRARDHQDRHLGANRGWPRGHRRGPMPSVRESERLADHLVEASGRAGGLARTSIAR